MHVLIPCHVYKIRNRILRYQVSPYTFPIIPFMSILLCLRLSLSLSQLVVLLALPLSLKALQNPEPSLSISLSLSVSLTLTRCLYELFIVICITKETLKLSAKLYFFFSRFFFFLFCLSKPPLETLLVYLPLFCF